jgi:branched-chain amino acid transport system substrate-binding protein
MSNLLMPRRALLASGAALMASAGKARAAETPIRIGVLADESSYSADSSGSGVFLAARMAAADFGPTLLGLPIEVLHADTQNKPDVAGAIARQMYDAGVDVIVDLPATPIAAAVQQIAAEKTKSVMVSAAASEEFVTKWCKPISTLWSDDTHALAAGAATPTVRAGGKTWFFITVDFVFGTSLERETTAIVEAAGGKILGSVRYQQNKSDFSSELLQAQASGAQVVGLCSVGGDLVNVIKQAGEFGLGHGGTQSLVGFLVDVTDIHALGLPTAQNLTFSSSFYWDQNDAARAFTKRFMAEHHAPPSREQALAYIASLHFLTSMAKAGSRDALAVNRAMRSLPFDYFGRPASVREDGRVLHDVTRYRAKTPAQSKGEWDLFEAAGVLPADEAFLPNNPACKV